MPEEKISKKTIFNRAELLLGEDVMERLAQTRVIIFGIGGVGSWCAESLVRSGIGHLTMVDSDCVAASNINRQAMAFTDTIGMAKVEVMKERLLRINPYADIIARQEVYSAETAQSFHLEEYDYVVDAIDSVSCKLELILHATKAVGKGRFFSAMGAALKTDPSKIRVSEFWDIDGCPLARALRKRMKKQERFPACKFRCVWSPEVAERKKNDARGDVKNDARGDVMNDARGDAGAPAENGSLVHVTAIFGFTLAGEILRKLKIEN